MAQKVSVVLTRGDLLADIACNFNTKTNEKKDEYHDMVNNDAAYTGRGSDQKPNGSVNLTEESNDLENNDMELPSNGFSPVSYYGSRKQIFTARIKLFSPSAHKRLTDNDEVLRPSRDSPGVKRNNKRQSSSSTMRKKRRTSNVARQCKTSGNKQTEPA